ncbi:MAG: type II secretion system protein [Candidatus Shapirobacteria bacterium]|nr:type II secretion system protein [Candidatus Shapirobacteria bacterium]
MKKNKKNKGFTLFELLVSISIIGILTALASVAFSGAQKKARDARRLQDVKAVQTAAEQWYSQNNYIYQASAGTWGTILAVYPVDPKTGVAYRYTHPDATNNTYCVCAEVENPANGNSVAGNSATNDCIITTPSASTNYFCAKNQQ